MLGSGKLPNFELLPLLAVIDKTLKLGHGSELDFCGVMEMPPLIHTEYQTRINCMYLLVVYRGW
jgi:hypothetical protein